ncbi:MAG: hypothetical protein WA130_11400 [Candidatus Methanoperedens sp.]
MTEPKGLFERICAGCIADYHGGFPDFCIGTLEKTWTGEGHCLRCNGILSREFDPEHWDSLLWYKKQIAEVDGLIAENQRLLNKYVGSLSLKLTEKQWQMHRADLVRKRDVMEAEWKKKPLGKKDVVQ